MELSAFETQVRAYADRCTRLGELLAWMPCQRRKVNRGAERRDARRVQAYGGQPAFHGANAGAAERSCQQDMSQARRRGAEQAGSAEENRKTVD